MILVGLDPKQLLYRTLRPRYAATPLSGAGAAKVGGRFNRPGIEALYLSLEPETALAEYQQTSSYLPPGTLCSFVAELPPMIDLRRLGEGVWETIWQDWTMDWRASAFDQGIDPITWELADMAIEAGASGILFPSTICPGGTNVVVFLAEIQPPHNLRVLDPEGLLPRDDASWRDG